MYFSVSSITPCKNWNKTFFLSKWQTSIVTSNKIGWYWFVLTFLNAWTWTWKEAKGQLSLKRYVLDFLTKNFE